MVGFYILALTASAALLWVAYAMFADLNPQTAPLFPLCLAGALSILWSIVPRPDRFVPPGPRLDPAREPELFGLLQELATATSQAMPTDVYIVTAPMAFVAQRGGVMGFGGHRVMALGLPLMHVLSVQEFKAMVVHEFGHFHAGDVALGPWTHKTRAAIDRTSFVPYARLFLRVTRAVSRRQELIADELAARVAGADAVISGLRKMLTAQAAFDGYWNGELGPIFGSGVRPPVNAGFARYLESPAVGAGVDVFLDHQKALPTRSYDTHPSLADRTAALAGFASPANGDERCAACLLSQAAELEDRVLATVSLDLAALKRVEWEQVAEVACMPIWRNRVKAHGHLLGRCTMATIPVARADLLRIGSSLFPAQASLPDDLHIGRAWQLVVGAIGVALEPLGWKPHLSPGTEVTFARNGHALRPWSELNAMTNGSCTRAEWCSRCAELGIDEVSLGIL
jgi:Zn-dependent protease with chaperone function